MPSPFQLTAFQTDPKWVQEDLVLTGVADGDLWIRRLPVPNYHFGPRCMVDGIPPFGHRRMCMPKEKDPLHDGFTLATATADNSTEAAVPTPSGWVEVEPATADYVEA